MRPIHCLLRAARIAPALSLLLFLTACGGGDTGNTTAPRSDSDTRAPVAPIVGFSQIGAESAWLAGETLPRRIVVPDRIFDQSTASAEIDGRLY